MAPKRSDFRFAHRLRVRWAEVDLQQIVFNGHYLTYLDTAISDYWRAMALPYASTMASLAGDLYVKKAALVYMASARYDDMLEVCLKCARIGNSSLAFEGAIFHGSTQLIEAELLYVFADPTTQTSRSVPQPLRDWLGAFEAGESMTSLAIEPWEQCQAEVMALRTAVFHQEQGIAAEMMGDALDAGCVHAVLRNRAGAAMAAGRLVRKADGAWHVGRMAVLRPLRGAGFGEQVLQALENAAWAQHAPHISLSAMASAQGFYARLGYQPCSQPYELVGLPHLDMQKHRPHA
jgi:YbgC/YbaW family acyl-CoA thioester hydrolase